MTTPDVLRGQLESQRREAREAMATLQGRIDHVHGLIKRAKEADAPEEALRGARAELDSLREKFAAQEGIVKTCSARLDELGGGAARTEGAKRR